MIMYGYEIRIMLTLSTYYTVGPTDRVSRGNLTAEDQTRVEAVRDRLYAARATIHAGKGPYSPAELRQMLQETTDVHLDHEDARLFEMMIGACLRELSDQAAIGPYITGCTREQAVETHGRLQTLLDSSRS